MPATAVRAPPARLHRSGQIPQQQGVMTVQVAIIGMSCKFPGADNYNEYWDNLCGKTSSITEVPPSRWDWRQYWGDPKSQTQKSHSKWGGFIRDVDAFDAGFFGILPKVAQTMDPQQRLMLELVWSCLEDAGVAPASLRGRPVGVMLGVFNHDYKEAQDNSGAAIEAHYSTGTAASIIANRVSHFFDFKGPSFPVDTACSSSLNAIHSAIQALQFGDCELALAGGVNLLLTPTRHIAFSRMGMLSPTGQCRTFDASADGYVRGEGAGVVLLKPLAQAQADGDAIYAVIKGSAVNHCGETYTLTYPSPAAQAAVIAEAHRRAAVPAGTVSYIETHGTGTPKGDPIEFAGLQQAFQQLAAEQQRPVPVGSCALGSVKTNIGHLEAAAGIAGVIKVVLAMRHRQLPALQNFSALNPAIDLADSPFRLLTDTELWSGPAPDPQAAQLPLRAGISSFGFGGTNAHLVLEAYAVPATAQAPAVSAALLLLSAKTPDALQRQKINLLAWLEQHPATSLAALSAGLMLGRDHHQFRCSAVVKDVKAAQRWLRDDLAATPMCVALDRDDVDGLAAASQTAQQLLAQLPAPALKKPYADTLRQLAALYLQGASPAWPLLFGDGAVPRLRLPTYPFGRDRHWLALPAPVLPLLQQLVPGDEQVLVHNRFTGQEFFLRDHQVHGAAVLPAAAYLETLVQALGQIIPATASAPALEISDVVWLRPVMPAQGQHEVSLHLRREPAATDPLWRAEFSSKADALVPVKHAQAKGRRLSGTGMTALPDLCYPAAQWQEVAVQQCYQQFRQAGFDYGEAHQTIRLLAQQPDQLLARLELPPSLQAEAAGFQLHPAVLDGALQAAVALLQTSTAQPGQAFLPFSLERLQVFGPTSQVQWAWVRLQTAAGGAALPKIAIDLLAQLPAADGRCQLIAQFTGLGLRPLAAPAATQIPAPVQSRLLKDPVMHITDSYYRPHWFDQPAVAGSIPAGTLLLLGAAADLPALAASLAQQPALAQTRLVLAVYGDTYRHSAGQPYQIRPGEAADLAALLDSLAAAQQLPSHVVVWDQPQHDAPAQQGLTCSAYQAFALVKACFKAVKSARFVHLVAGAGAQVVPLYQALSAFYKTVKVERPAFNGRVVLDCATARPVAAVAAMIAAELGDPQLPTDIRYRAEQRQVRDFVAVSAADLAQTAAPASGFRHGGVYLISGGMGGLGLLVARHLLQQYQATVFLTGRSALSAQKQQLLDSTDAGTSRLFYRSCDITDAAAVSSLVSQMNQDGYWLHGVIHSAGVIEDSFLLKKPADTFARVIAPKVQGTLNLDLATRQQPLELFVLFSSVTGVLGNLGQADYAYGNAFEDYFSFWRNDLSAGGARPGTAVSVNWPYWRDGGMVLSEKETEILRKNFGIVPLDNAAGLEALEFAVSAGLAQLAVLPGEAAKIQQVLGVRHLDVANVVAQPAAAHLATPALLSAPATPALKAQVVQYLTALFARTVALPAETFELMAPFSQYGFDSVVMVDLVIELEQTFANLPATLFFEHQNLAALADYFVEHHASYFSAEVPQQPVATMSVPPAANACVLPAEPAPQQAGAVSPDQDEIVIIGVSGRYPQADDLSEYWQNLHNGVDCIREIPAERGWDLAALFQPGPATFGKSYSKWGGFLTGVDQFDPLFFGIAPAEAEVMDPHERLFLETVAQAIADAGYSPDRLAAPVGVHDHPVGVYVGTMWGDYQLYGVEGGAPKAMLAPRSWYWAVANRISYQFNFSGPSMALDTACSGSLTALHLACEALKRAEISVAVAGGVNLSLHPQKYNSLSDLHFLSSDGRCRSFGAGGDGYVPAEAVGAVILKRRADALRDGDFIYAVIKGTTLNHGGKTSGFTVPNPNRQAALIKDALARAGVDPAHISYVEAHGTGTSLGDPIEITGLSKAFGQSQPQRCAIGSVKSNIGHAEAAAGIAGITKILLQLKHRTLVPSLHSATPNPYLKLAQSPFYVLQAAQPWLRPTVQDARSGAVTELPLLAGLSSFGAGGANAHVILAEYPPELDPRHQARPAAGPCLVLLSARHDSALTQMVTQLLAFIGREPATALADIAYTLQTGRQALDYALAVIAGDLAELQDKLRQYLAGAAADSAAIFAGKRQRNARQRQPVEPQILAQWLATRALPQLATAWLGGEEQIDWRQLYPAGAAFRIALPGYVYHRQRYWVEVPPNQAAAVALTPLLDRNVSTLTQTVFVKTFQPQQFYLADHKLGNKSVLPGVVSLEMARQAAALAGNDAPVLGLADIRWLKPLVVGAQAETVQLHLQPVAGQLQFTLCKAAAGGGTLQYSQGAVLLPQYCSAAQRQRSDTPPPRLDQALIRARCTEFSAAETDAAFRNYGFDFGPTFQVIRQLYSNQTEAMAVLALTAAQRPAPAGFALHPALLDAALRTAVGIGGFAAGAGLPLPVSLDLLVIHQSLSADCISYAVLAAQQPQSPQQTAYDIYLFNPQGEALLSLYGLVTQAVSHVASARPSPAAALQSGPPAAAGSPTQWVLHYLTGLVAATIKLEPSQLDPALALEQYGIDSVMIMAMNDQLETVFGPSVPKTLFFEYPDLHSLAAYFAEHHSAEVATLQPVSAPAPAVPLSGPATPADSRPAVLQYLRTLLSRVTKVAADQIDADSPLENYGVDSVMVMAMNDALAQQFGDDLPKTLFFEYQTLDELSGFLQSHYPAQVQALGTTAPALAPASPERAVTPANPIAGRPADTAALLPQRHTAPLTAAEQLKQNINALSDAEVEQMLRELQAEHALETEF